MATRTETAIFASGCFWGTEYHFKRAPGVIYVRPGYTGGLTPNPDYRQVCAGSTGHAEAVEVVYDPDETSFDTLARLFFETHDPTQVNRQGPDIGDQYRSEIFYLTEDQRLVAEKLIGLLREKGLQVATELTRATDFWPAEEEHQDYYGQTGYTPYCHIYTPRFNE